MQFQFNPFTGKFDLVHGNATTSNKGVVELSTDAEAIAGVSTTVVITPSNLTAALAAFTPTEDTGFSFFIS